MGFLTLHQNRRNARNGNAAVFWFSFSCWNFQEAFAESYCSQVFFGNHAIVLAVGAYLLYPNNWSATTVAPPVTQNNITLTAPAAKNPDLGAQPAPAVITPVPATPPAAEKTAPVTPDPAKPAQ